MLATIDRWLTTERRPAVLYVIAAFIGLTFGAYVIGWEGIAGTGEYWTTTHNDTVQSIAGLRYYINEPWGWPLFDIASYGFPTGTNLALTGSIPGLAVVAKLFSGLLPSGFHYFGYWLLLCFVMQAVAMVALLVVLGWRDYTAALTGAVIALLQTVLLVRYAHVSFMAQFLLTLTILLGVKATNSSRPGREMTWLALLVGVAFLIQVYLYVMVAVLAVAFVLGLPRQGRIGWKPVAWWLGAVSLGSAVLVWASGLLGTHTAGAVGFGTYSTNLLSLVVAQPDATGGQYEGFAYVGLGVIVLGAIALVAGRGDLMALLSKYWVPVVAIAAMCVYALSTQVYFGDRLVLNYSDFGPISWLGERFRSSGRFVWPLVYALVPTVMILVRRRLQRPLVVLVLLGALLLQTFDMVDTVSVTRNGLHRETDQILATATWRDLVASHTLIRMTPHPCVVGTGATAFASREIQRIAAEAGVAITTNAAAAQGSDCEDRSLAATLAPGELRVLWRGVSPVPNDPSTCTEFDLGIVCTLAGPVDGAALTP